MHSTLEQLALWDKSTFKRFILFVQSPYFNKRSALIDIVLALKPYHPHFKKYDLNKMIPPDLSDSANHKAFLTKRLSDLNLLINQFLQQQILEEDKDVQSQLNQIYYRKYNTYKAFDIICNAEIDRLSQKKIQDVESLSRLINVCRRLFNHPQYTNAPSREGLLEEDVLKYTNAYYVLVQLKYIADDRVKQKTKAEHYHRNTEAFVLKQAEQLSNDFPLIKFYYQIIKSFDILFDKELDRKDFHNLLDSLERLLPHLSVYESSFALAKMSSIGIRCYIRNQIIFAPLLMDVYKIGVTYNAYKEEGAISERAFDNIVVTAGLQKEFEWAQQFITDHIHHFPASSRKSAKNLSKATLFFYEGKYTEALNLLKEGLKRRSVYKMRMHVLSIQCHLGFHLEKQIELSVIRNKKEQFSKMIYRQKSVKNKTPYLNFAKAVYQIAKLRSFEWNHPDFDKKLNNILSTDNLHMKISLRKQVNRARNNKK